MTSIGQKLTQIPTTLTEVKFEFYVKKKILKIFSPFIYQFKYIMLNVKHFEIPFSFLA